MAHALGHYTTPATTRDTSFALTSRPSSISRTMSSGVMKRRSWVTITRVFAAVAQEADRFLAAGPVEVTGRLVGEDQLRFVDQRPRHRHALLLSARKLGGTVVEAAAHADLRSGARSAFALNSGVTPSGM